MKSIIRYIVLVVAFTFLGCAVSHKNIPFNTSGADKKKVFLACLKRRNKEVKGLSSSAKIVIKGIKEKVSFNCILLIELPDRLRLEIMDFWGRRIKLISMIGNHIFVYSLKDNCLWRAKATKEGVYKLTEILIDPLSFANAVLGIFPGIGTATLVSYEEVDGHIRASLRAKYKGVKFNVEGDLLSDRYFRLKKLEISDDKSNRWSYKIVYDDYKYIDSILVSNSVNIFLGVEGQVQQRISVLLRDCRINPVVKRQMFMFMVPMDVRVYDVDDGY